MEGQVVTDALDLGQKMVLLRHALHSLEWFKWERRSREPEVLVGLGWSFG